MDLGIRLLLAAIGLLYGILAGWCSLAPTVTSGKVGFALRPGTGQSEFLVVYGGLELGLALVFLMPLVVPSTTQTVLWACFLIHLSLVIFRTVSFFLYSGIEPFTYRLALGEWLILVLVLGSLIAGRGRT